MINIHAATTDDETVVTSLGNKVLAHHQAFDSFYQPVSEDSGKPPEPEKIIFIARDDGGEVVGYIQGIFRSDPADRSVPFATIQSVWVEVAARGQGVAQQLVETFEKVAKAKGAQQVELFVDVRNEQALTLWGSAGYDVYQEKRRKLL